MSAIDAFHGHAFLVGAAAGPGTLIRTGSGATSYTGRFALRQFAGQTHSGGPALAAGYARGARHETASAC